MRPFDPRLLRAVPEARVPIAALAALGVLSGVATVATVFALAALVVAVVDQGGLTTPSLVLAALFALRALLATATERVTAWVGVHVCTALRSRLAAHWAALPVDDRPEPARAITLLTSGAAAVEPYAARYLPTLVTAAVVPVLVVGTLVVIDWPSAMVVVLTLPLLPLFAALIGRATQEQTEARWGALQALAGHFLDAVRGLGTLVTYGRAERQVQVVREVSERHRAATLRTLRLAFLSSAALELLATLSVAIVAVTVGLRLSWGSMSLGVGLVAILLSPEAYWPVRRVGQEFHTAADGAVALHDLLAALDDADAAQPRASSTTVRVEGVHYRHPGTGLAVLRDVSLCAGPGLTVVTGTSGAGKSTLLDLVAGLRTPTHGTVQAGPVHYVTQRPFLSAPTVRDSLTMGGDHDDTAVWTALRATGADGMVAGLPAGLDTPLGDDGFGLSAGQGQRLALARAWLATEPVLLLDEPTAHLDPRATASVIALVRELAERRTVIAVTHDPALLAAADAHVTLAAQLEAAP